MPNPDTPADPVSLARIEDPDRLAALLQTELLDSESEAAFERLTRLASRLVHAPVTLVSLVDARRQFFKSHVGLREPWATRGETPLTHSFCKHVVASGRPLIIEDARTDPLVAENRAIDEIGVVAYAGIPLNTPEGHTLGSFCAIDDHPRHWTEEEIETLADLADSVMTEIELRLAARAARREIVARERAEAEREVALDQLKTAYAREKRIATSLQECMLVFPRPGCFPGLDIEVLYQPASSEAEVGGDFFDTFALPGKRVALVVGDASGKGLAAAVRTAEVKYALRAYLRDVDDPNPDLAQILARLNRFLFDSRDSSSRAFDGFISLSLAITHRDTGETVVGRAGADPPLLLRAGEDGASAEEVSPRGAVLGVAASAPFEVQLCRLAPGDALLLFTDGLTEARRGRRELLGYEGVKRLAHDAVLAAPPSSPLRHVADAIAQGAHDFAGGALTDDACLLLARRTDAVE